MIFVNSKIFSFSKDNFVILYHISNEKDSNKSTETACKKYFNKKCVEIILIEVILRSF